MRVHIWVSGVSAAILTVALTVPAFAGPGPKKGKCSVASPGAPDSSVVAADVLMLGLLPLAAALLRRRRRR